MYLFKPKNPASVHDWKADGHKWSNQGTSKLPRTKPIIKKTYFVLKNDDAMNKGFKKESFQLTNGSIYTLLHYLGDHQLSKPGPHGNVGQQTKLFFPTKQSVLTTIGESVSVGQVPNRVYKCCVVYLCIVDTISTIENNGYHHKVTYGTPRDVMYDMYRSVFRSVPCFSIRRFRLNK